MVKNIMKAFRPVRFEYGNIHMVGGYCTKPVAIKSKTVDTADGTIKTFVKLSGMEAWLLTATTGSCTTSRNSFHRTSLLRDLRVHINRICDAGIGDTVDNPIESDPMLELAASPGAICVGRPAKFHATKHAKVQRWRYRANMAKNCISTFDMPYECPEIDPTGTKLRTVTVYVQDRLQIWLSVDDVAWAVEYLYKQNSLKGIPVVAADDAGPGAPPQLMAILGEGDTADADDA
jgi:hypothetical protein